MEFVVCLFILGVLQNTLYRASLFRENFQNILFQLPQKIIHHPTEEIFSNTLNINC